MCNLIHDGSFSKKLLVFSCLLECRTKMLIIQGERFDAYKEKVSESACLVCCKTCGFYSNSSFHSCSVVFFVGFLAGIKEFYIVSTYCVDFLVIVLSFCCHYLPNNNFDKICSLCSLTFLSFTPCLDASLYFSHSTLSEF